MSTGETSTPTSNAGACRIVLFTGPHAHAPLHLAALRRATTGLVIARCRTLLDFARALKAPHWSLVVVDCGPGNPRLADVLAIYRRSGADLPLAVVGEPTPPLVDALQGVETCVCVAPDDADGLARAVMGHCPNLTVAEPIGREDAAAAARADGSAPLGRAAFVESLGRPHATDSGSAVLVVLGFAAGPPLPVLAEAVRGALQAVGLPPEGLAVLAADRLAVLLDSGPTDAAQGVDLAQRLRQGLQSRVAAADVSVAVALCPARPSDPDAEHWLARAERACSDVAARSEHGYAVLSRMPVTTPSARTLPALVQEAIAGNRLALVFQPIVSLRGDAREHYEVLIRLPTVAAGEMLPGDFLAAAEGAGLMPAVDQWVLRAAIRRLAQERAAHRRTHFFVALSAAGLRDERLVVTLCDELAAAGARGDWLTVQLKSRDVSRHTAAAGRLVASLRKIHCQVAMDRYEHDVTGQELVATLRFDFVKLAPALTQGVATDAARLERLSDAVGWLARHDVRTVATAVEDAHGLAYLWTAGIDYAQGYFLQEPSGEIAYGDG